MTRAIRLSLLGVALLLLAACGTPQTEEPTTTEAPATTEAAPDTTVAEPETTTSTAAPSTTTTSEAPEGGESNSLMAALDAEAEVTSARVEGSIEMSGLDEATMGTSEAVILFSTAFDATTGDSSFFMDMSSLMGSAEIPEGDELAEMAAGMFSEMEVRQIGDTSYVKFPFFTSMLGAQTEWMSMPAEEGQSFTSDFESMPTDPNDLLSTFDGEEGVSLEELGTETVNGVTAVHYRVSLDIDEMDLTATEEAELAESGILTEGLIPLDIWISEDGYMVRMVMEIDGSGIETASPAESFDTMTMRYDVYDINQPVAIEAPPASEVTPMEDLEGSFGFDG